MIQKLMKQSLFSAKVVITLLIVNATILSLSGQEDARWLRYPAISPDGQSILFNYKGDIYKVASTGGTAIPLTLSDSHEYGAVWSNDGQTIAFASDRYGNFDIFVMPASRG